MKKVLAVIGSILFCPLVFLALFEVNLRFTLGMAPLYLCYPLAVVLYFLIAGRAFRPLGLGRRALWLWMNLAGYPLCWAALTLRVPGIWFNLGILLLFLPITAALLLAWGVVGLLLLLVRLARTPRLGRRALSLGRRAAGAAAPLLLAVAALGMAASGYRYLTIRPAGEYTDRGVYTFVASECYPTSETVSQGGRTRQRTVYRVVYKASGTGYRYTEDAVSQSAGTQLVREKRAVDRRVLSITGENLYITVEADETAERYVQTTRRNCLVVFGVSGGCLTAAAVWYIRKKQKEELRAAAG